jgi:hypothetical protein
VLVARFPPGTQASQRQAEVEKVYLQAIATQAFDWIVADKIYPGWLPAYVPNGDFIVDEGITFPGRGQSMAPGFLLKKNPYTSSGLTGAQFYLLSHHH